MLGCLVPDQECARRSCRETASAAVAEHVAVRGKHLREARPANSSLEEASAELELRHQLGGNVGPGEPAGESIAPSVSIPSVSIPPMARNLASTRAQS
eukprot:scaffold36_cov397-Prasinococcus_capsulatus_cf.AAC.3